MLRDIAFDLKEIKFMRAFQLCQSSYQDIAFCHMVLQDN